MGSRETRTYFRISERISGGIVRRYGGGLLVDGGVAGFDGSESSEACLGCRSPATAASWVSITTE